MILRVRVGLLCASAHTRRYAGRRLAVGDDVRAFGVTATGITKCQLVVSKVGGGVEEPNNQPLAVAGTTAASATAEQDVPAGDVDICVEGFLLLTKAQIVPTG